MGATPQTSMNQQISYQARRAITHPTCQSGGASLNIIDDDLAIRGDDQNRH